MWCARVYIFDIYERERERDAPIRVCHYIIFFAREDYDESLRLEKRRIRKNRFRHTHKPIHMYRVFNYHMITTLYY